MHLMNSTPKSLANQQFVMSPDWEGNYNAETIYAASPEAAVEEVRKVFAEEGEKGEIRLENIHAAEGAELPWNDPKVEAYVFQKEGSQSTAVYFGDEAEARSTYEFLFEGKPFMMRPATAAEREESIRNECLCRDRDEEEQFNYGFNVLYKEHLENGTL